MENIAAIGVHIRFHTAPAPDMGDFGSKITANARRPKSLRDGRDSIPSP